MDASEGFAGIEGGKPRFSRVPGVCASSVPLELAFVGDDVALFRLLPAPTLSKGFVWLETLLAVLVRLPFDWLLVFVSAGVF
jgi:hypothetical protein